MEEILAVLDCGKFGIAFASDITAGKIAMNSVKLAKLAESLGAGFKSSLINSNL